MPDKEEIRGCAIRKDLYYRVEDHTWVKVNDDGTVFVGMTDVAQNMAGPLLHAKAKGPGTKRDKGKPIATVESGKWVGPVKAPISGEIIEVNSKVAQDAKLINQSPYNEGWIVKMKPSNLQAELAEMQTGEAAVEAYRQKIEKEDLKACVHVEGFEA
ncbi:MAG: glycine cleavage system protein GcvH [candidate division KSB1 bacterium]|nr:glycine cleavage system protein GcvH [candidate division KSB1 bacterium]MDZ7274075.1 glycine cleavage system protein GcvH [candidate division KSB1 bacterium]MDZ7287879.1 glycine cleavage system protein GcvH [candidate division KSB1 bacterium]MDZ7296675.1 glycine cleavage system protein GcvH [candidate division KSB1 bacterium]MDZ7307292.1 glycine cleavage system protein GcvH [candidate division KSB1 bacterium]